ncbi:MAG: anti-sigma factor [Dehalococcoidia bacterium]|nr:anti-sigma factor [Dehalococcoidia bacterium]
MSHARIRDRLPDFALDLLERDAADEVEEHLPRCEACHAEARLYAQAAAALTLRTPPPRLGEGVLDRIAAHVAEEAAAAVPAATAADARRGSGSGWRSLAFVLGFLVVLLAGLAGAAGVGWYQARDEADTATDTVAKRAIQLALKGGEGLQVQGLAFVASDYSGGVVSIDGLPQLSGSEQLYVLWSESPTATRNLRPFNTSRDGKALISFGATPRKDGRLFVTREPYPPPTAPTGPVVVSLE